MNKLETLTHSIGIPQELLGHCKSDELAHFVSKLQPYFGSSVHTGNQFVSERETESFYFSFEFGFSMYVAHMTDQDKDAVTLLQWKMGELKPISETNIASLLALLGSIINLSPKN